MESAKFFSKVPRCTYVCVRAVVWLSSVAENCGQVVWLSSVAENCGQVVWLSSVAENCVQVVWLSCVAENCGQVVWLFSMVALLFSSTASSGGSQ